MHPGGVYPGKPHSCKVTYLKWCVLYITSIHIVTQILPKNKFSGMKYVRVTFPRGYRAYSVRRFKTNKNNIEGITCVRL